VPELRRVLADHDHAFLKLAAELWGHELAAGSQREAVDEVAALLLAPGRAPALAADLPPAARAALDQLARAGRQPLPHFTRRHGELRAMGPARREREKPWANAPSATESLWYRALIGRAFFDDGRGPEEFFFIPDDLRALLWVGPASPDAALVEPPGWPLSVERGTGGVERKAKSGEREATSAEHDTWRLTPDTYAERDTGRLTPDTYAERDTGRLTPDTYSASHDLVTLLAYLQVHTVRPESAADPHTPTLPHSHTAALAPHLLHPAALPLYLHLLQALGLAQAGPGREPFKLDPDKVQPFLQAAPAERLRQLAEAWRDARDWNDLRRVPGLVFEGTNWRNDPLTARQAILSLLRGVPPAAWWDTDSFVQAVKDRQPDYQRPAGDYDSWYIRDPAGQFLRGFENWERVDGALVRWLIAQPLRWLGLVETTTAPDGFRLTRHGAALLGLAGWEAPDGDDPPPPDLRPDGEVRVPALARALDRFQLARIAEWRAPEADAGGWAYVYRLTPAALARAAAKGITVPRILPFLERAAPGHPALPALAAALLRWERSGAEASLHDALILKLARPELLDTLRRVPRLRDWLGETLGPGLVAVRREHAADLRAALAELGILLDLDV
jgi:hypothetical protein